MASSQTITVTGIVKTDPKEKENMFNKEKLDLTFAFAIEKQIVPLGDDEKDTNESGWIFTSSSNASKQVRETLKKGDRVLLTLKLTGAYKDGAYPSKFYLNCSYVQIITTSKATLNLYSGKATIETVNKGVVEGTTDIFLKEAKAPTGTNKAKLDYSKPESYHYYRAVYNKDISSKLKSKQTCFFTGTLFKGQVEETLSGNAGEDDKKKQPMVLLENIIF